MKNNAKSETSQLRDRNGLTEEEFLKRYNPDKYPKPALTADVVIFREDRKTPQAVPEVLLIRRGGHPYLGCWAFPGGFAEENEALEQTAARELSEETGIEGLHAELVGVYSAPGRDPRGWVVSAAYAAVVGKDEVRAQAGDDAAGAEWFEVRENGRGRFAPVFPEGEENTGMAFDHEEILNDAVQWYRAGQKTHGDGFPG